MACWPRAGPRATLFVPGLPARGPKDLPDALVAAQYHVAIAGDEAGRWLHMAFPKELPNSAQGRGGGMWCLAR